VINILVPEEPTNSIHIRDSMDQTPLHAAASCSDDDDSDLLNPNLPGSAAAPQVCFIFIKTISIK